MMDQQLDIPSATRSFAIGNACLAEDDFQGAIAAFSEALRKYPHLVEALYNCGVAYHHLMELDNALDCYEKAIRLAPDLAEAHFNLAHLQKQINRLPAAVESLQNVLKLQPGNADAAYRLGELYQSMGRTAEAFSAFESALRIRPDYAEALYRLGMIWRQQDSPAQAFICFEQALIIKPDYVDARKGLNDIRHQRPHPCDTNQNCIPEIVPSHPFSTAAPADAEYHFRLGSALREKEQFEESLIHLAKAVELRPDHAEAWNNLALACKNIGEFKRAMACLNRALDIKPDLAEAHWNRSFLHLLNDDYDRGWSDFEWRFRIAQRRFIYPFDLPGVRWNGTPDPSAAILVNDEQGLGDTLQFVRYLPLVKTRCRKVILETRPNLLSLLNGQPGIDQIIVRSTDGRPHADYDMHVPLMSLPKVFGTHARTIPTAMPYIVADPRKVAHWGGKLAGAAPKVGLVWSGNPHHTNDRNRSCPLATLMPLLEIPGIQFIGLQKGPGAEQAATLSGIYHFTNWDNEQCDFSDTAAIVSHLDLVITVDTAMAHLAGALAKPVWLMLSYVPDWRWGLQRNDTPWYPTMRLFRQPRLKAWEPVVHRIASALTALVDQRRSHCSKGGHP